MLRFPYRRVLTEPDATGSARSGILAAIVRRLIGKSVKRNRSRAPANCHYGPLYRFESEALWLLDG